MEEGQISRWVKNEGDTYEAGETLAEVDTDKATMEMTALSDGTILKILKGAGDTALLGEAIAIIGKAGEDISALVERNLVERQPSHRRQRKQRQNRLHQRAARKWRTKRQEKQNAETTSPTTGSTPQTSTVKSEARHLPRFEWTLDRLADRRPNGG